MLSITLRVLRSGLTLAVKLVAVALCNNWGFALTFTDSLSAFGKVTHQLHSAYVYNGKVARRNCCTIMEREKQH